MSTQVTTAMTNAYSAAVHYTASQEVAVLTKFFLQETQAGEETYFDQIGVVDMADASSRHADTVYTDTPHTRRRVTPVVSRLADLIDKPDRVKTAIDPSGPYARRHAEAWGRRLDDHIIDAAFANSSTGRDGSGTETWSSAGNIVAINFGGPNIGLTFAKVREAQRLLNNNNIPQEGRVAVVGDKEVDELMAISQATSGDYVSTRPLVEGEVGRWMGFNWVMSTRLGVVAGGGQDDHRRCIFGHRDGMMLATYKPFEARVDELPNKNYSTQIWAEGIAGATRMEAARMVEVICDESP